MLDNAIEGFGPIPRDAYRGVLDLPGSTLDRDLAVRLLTYDKLKGLIEKFFLDQKFTTLSYQIIAVYLSATTVLSCDQWEMRFKSNYIASAVMEKAWSADDKPSRTPTSSSATSRRASLQQDVSSSRSVIACSPTGPCQCVQPPKNPRAVLPLSSPLKLAFTHPLLSSEPPGSSRGLTSGSGSPGRCDARSRQILHPNHDE